MSDTFSNPILLIFIKFSKTFHSFIFLKTWLYCTLSFFNNFFILWKAVRLNATFFYGFYLSLLCTPFSFKNRNNNNERIYRTKYFHILLDENVFSVIVILFLITLYHRAAGKWKKSHIGNYFDFPVFMFFQNLDIFLKRYQGYSNLFVFFKRINGWTNCRRSA